MGELLVKISVIQPSELGAAEIGAWHDMQDMTPEFVNPFLSPEFAIAVGQVRSATRVAVLTEGQDIIGFFPFERRRLGAGVAIAAGLTDFQGLIHVPDADWDARALLRACRLSAWQFDHMVSGQKPFEQFQSAVAPSPVMDLSGGFAAYYASLKNKSHVFCNQLNRRARKLTREAGEPRLVADSQDIRILRTLMDWKSAQYRYTGRIDRFSQRWVVELVDLLFATRTPSLAGRLSVLYAGDVPIAANFGLQCSSIMAFWFPAYDVRFRKYSPGLLHHVRCAEEKAAEGVELIHLGKGTTRYKESLKNADLSVAEGIVTRATPTGAAHWALRTPQAWLIRQIRANPSLFRAADTVLRRGAQVRNSL
jgi:CelD/BcsL family acetyltransferase involved in cellulose biosynthesis